jgi:hypothetical protein
VPFVDRGDGLPNPAAGRWLRPIRQPGRGYRQRPEKYQHLSFVVVGTAIPHPERELLRVVLDGRCHGSDAETGALRFAQQCLHATKFIDRPSE